VSGQRPAQFVLTLQAPAAADGIKLLRHALKVLGRRYKLKCVALRELDTAAQLDLVGTPTPQPPDRLHGLLAQLPKPCRCGAELTIVGPGKGPHAASLHCAECQTHRGWISHATYKFLTETVKQFGRPESPIILRRPSPVPPAASDSASAAETKLI
jgi:hypothetical protein